MGNCLELTAHPYAAFFQRYILSPQSATQINAPKSSRLSKLDNGFSVVDTLSSPLGAFASEELFLTTVMGWDGHDDLVDRSIDR